MTAERQWKVLLKISESLPFCEGLKNLSNYCFEFPTKSLKQKISTFFWYNKRTGALFLPENDQEAAKLCFQCSKLLLLRFGGCDIRG